MIKLGTTTQQLSTTGTTVQQLSMESEKIILCISFTGTNSNISYTYIY